MPKSDPSHRFVALVALVLSLAACGGDGGTDPNPNGDPTAAERAAMASALTDAATAASGDALFGALLSGAAGAVQNGLTVTAGIRSGTGAPEPFASSVAGPPSAPRVFTIAVGVQLVNDPVGITGWAGAVVINGTSVAFGLGKSSFGTFPTTAVGGIVTGPNAGWVATAGTVGGLIQSLGPAGCGVNLASPVVQCQPAVYKLVSLDVTQSAPMNFQGNTATGSSTFSMPSRSPVSGVQVTVDCNLTSFC